jgi:hypothetical protein
MKLQPLSSLPWAIHVAKKSQWHNHSWLCAVDKFSKSNGTFSAASIAAVLVLLLSSHSADTSRASQSTKSDAKTRIAVVGLDHDHVWGLLKDIAGEPEAELIAVADPHPELVSKAKAQLPATVKFYSDYVQMLDEAKPEAVIATTENDRHLENFAGMRETSHPLLDGKAHGHQRRRCP